MAEKEIKATEQTDMDKLTTEMMEHICDEICQHSNNGRLNQDELDDICAECKMGQFVCDILNAYNRLNEFDKTQSYDLLKKLSEYRNLEEQGLLLKLPCKIGDDVYMIPSKANYDLNVLHRHEESNRVYRQKVDRICLDDEYWWLECDKDREYGTGRICVDKMFGETWFLSREEAQAALEKMKGDKPKQYVLVSQGIEIYRTTDKEEAERMMNESNSKYYEYLQRCADEGERPADNMIYLYEEE